MVTVVFSYPEHSKRHTSTIKHINSLIEIVNSEYKINFPARHINGHLKYHSLSQFFIRFFDFCKKTWNCVDIRWLTYINWIIENPTEDVLLTIKSMIGSDFQSLEPFLLEAQKNSESSRQAVGPQFFSLEGISLKEGPWGACCGNYPLSVAAETTGQRESIFHEFLHLFTVTEGYHKKLKTPLRGCENCWMQWAAVNGRELCGRHRHELIMFLQKVQSVSATSE